MAAFIGHTNGSEKFNISQRRESRAFAYVGDSILGSGVNLGAGTKLANFKG